METTHFSGTEKYKLNTTAFKGTENFKGEERDFRAHKPTKIMKQATEAVESLSKVDVYENMSLWVAGNYDQGHPCFDVDCEHCTLSVQKKCLTYTITRFIDDDGVQQDYQERYVKGGKIWCCGRPIFKGECYLCDQLSA